MHHECADSLRGGLVKKTDISLVQSRRCRQVEAMGLAIAQAGAAYSAQYRSKPPGAGPLLAQVRVPGEALAPAATEVLPPQGGRVRGPARGSDPRRRPRGGPGSGCGAGMPPKRAASQDGAPPAPAGQRPGATARGQAAFGVGTAGRAGMPRRSGRGRNGRNRNEGARMGNSMRQDPAAGQAPRPKRGAAPRSCGGARRASSAPPSMARGG